MSTGIHDEDFPLSEFGPKPTPTASLTTPADLELAQDIASDWFVSLSVGVQMSLEPDDQVRLRDMIANEMALCAAQVRRAQWQPISTAPKDGTHVLLYREDQGVFEGHYWAHEDDINDGVEPIWWSVEGQDLGAPDLMPTLWQPLPEGPEPSPVMAGGETP